MNILELNNVRKDTEIVNAQLTKYSPVVEVFSALVNGESLERFGKRADKAVEYIKGLGTRANNGDYNAMSELNTIRRYVIESPILEEMKLLQIFGSYQNVGFDETIEREIYKYSGDRSRFQANNGDVVFPAISKERYTVPTFTVSGGYEVDYRRVELGDMSKENEGMRQVRTDILNKAKLAIFTKVYNAIANATGVKYAFSASGLTKTGVDGVLNKVRRNGRPSVVGDYAMLAQFTPWAGYLGTISASTITGISDAIINELAANGLLGQYNGAALVEMANPYNYYEMNSAGTNFATLIPANVAFVIPTGVDSPIATWTRGGLTSLSGNDIKTGKIVTRFDLECAVDVAKGEEHKIGVLRDESIEGI